MKGEGETTSEIRYLTQVLRQVSNRSQQLWNIHRLDKTEEVEAGKGYLERVEYPLTKGATDVPSDQEEEPSSTGQN